MKLTIELLLKPSPLIVTTVPTAARLGDSPVTDSEGVNLPGLAARPAAWRPRWSRPPRRRDRRFDLRGESTVKLAVRPPKGTCGAPEAAAGDRDRAAGDPRGRAEAGDPGRFEATRRSAPDIGGRAGAVAFRDDDRNGSSPTALAGSGERVPVAPAIAVQVAPRSCRSPSGR